MSNTLNKGSIPKKLIPIKNRPLDCLPADQAAVAALMQAAINVENFTIPLYLASLSSIQGTHAISGAGIKGRLWPGMVTTVRQSGVALTPNQDAYNTIFSVFVQEMLHLQLAANLATVLGVTPKFFKGTVLENADKGWSCYGADKTVIPHIIDLTDTSSFARTIVNLGALNSSQIRLFLAIEQSHDAALGDINPNALENYFPAVPFANWTKDDTEKTLPLFGTIGWMYYCLMQYLTMEYHDGASLWSKMFNADYLDQQRDLFNDTSSSHPRSEYPMMPTRITASDPDLALIQAIDVVHGIVNQGEGGVENILKAFRLIVRSRIDPQISLSDIVTLKEEVTDNRIERQYQPDHCAMKKDYPYEPGNVDARAHGDMLDHWDRFNRLSEVVADSSFMNFAQWFAGGNVWTGADLQAPDYMPDPAFPNLPTPDEVATALNQLNSPAYQQLLAQLVAGAINGINDTLTKTWTQSAQPFPMQAMRASGDRMSLYWAVFGAAPDLSSASLPAPGSEDDTHACQGLSIVNPGNNCAAISSFHTCSSSNSCKGQGGCGYPIPTGSSNDFIAPSDNTCAMKGGCAAPISAWQTYGSGGNMPVVNIDNGEAIVPSASIAFNQGDSVYGTAWDAYVAVMKSKNIVAGTAPQPNPLRIVLPPN